MKKIIINQYKLNIIVLSEALLFIVVNYIFSRAAIDNILIIIFNALLLHRIALANHFAQHFIRSEAVVKINSSFLFLTLKAKDKHFDHHKYFNTSKDPDFYIYNPKTNIYLHLIKLIFAPLLNHRENNVKLSYSEFKQNTFAIIVMQTSIFTLFQYFYEDTFSYILLFIIPLILAKIINDFRVLIEHYDPITHTGVYKELNGIPILGIFISSYGFESHIQHHARPNINERKVKKRGFSSNHYTELKRIIKYG